MFSILFSKSSSLSKFNLIFNKIDAPFFEHFKVLSGDRYGFRPIPVQLEVNAFEVIRQEANKLEVENSSLLDEWYKLDENCVPNRYILQVIYMYSY